MIIPMIMRKVVSLSGISDIPYQISYEREYLVLVLSIPLPLESKAGSTNLAIGFSLSLSLSLSDGSGKYEIVLLTNSR